MRRICFVQVCLAPILALQLTNVVISQDGADEDPQLLTEVDFDQEYQALVPTVRSNRDMFT